MAIVTALTLKALFRLALCQTEGLIGSIIALLGLDLAVPGHSTLIRRAETLEEAWPRSGSRPVHLLVDSTEHLGTSADTGRIVAATVTGCDVDDASQVNPLLDQVAGLVAAFTADGAYDQGGVHSEVATRHPNASVVVPPRSSAVPSGTADTAPTQRDRDLRLVRAQGLAESVEL